MQFDLLRRNSYFRYLWYAQWGSTLGDWFNQVALMQTVLMLTNSISAVGILLLCRSLPYVFLGPILSPLVDKWPKKTIMIVTDIIRAFLVLSFILAISYKAIFVLYICSFLFGVMSVLFEPAKQTLLPLIVGRKDLAEANAFSSATNATVNIIGAILGGIVSSVFSPITCFVINSLSFLWSSLYIYKIKYQEKREFEDSKQPYKKLLKEGLVETKQNTLIRYIILIGLSWGLVGGGYYILIPYLGNNVYHLGGLGIGLLYAIDGLGILLGTYFVSKLIKANFKRALISFGVAYAFQALWFFLLTQSTDFYYGSAFLFLMRFCGGIIIPLSTYMVQVGTSDEIRGRVFALYNSSYVGIMQISYFGTGYAYEQFGLPVVGLISGVVSLLCGLTWLFQVQKGKFYLSVSK
ncbi:Predicted arabinose efflux permease, MFS family [Marininema halotolerans]|uniref:Predicted arabinose efflux permease, MFS family n=2 Tax=Marininema halotolerans TaxID=1155944 RepID=A0A1I6PYR3_9BACL|nr:MFS transporter [Marininema halotolerans]SFS45302.1 Predicted arabinose efflux permease, MFS family [Marininema halotolerans]